MADLFPQDTAPELEHEAAQQQEFVPSSAEVGVSAVDSRTQPPVWQRMLAALRGSPAQQGQRLVALDAAIEQYPDTPTNFVLRGELYLQLGESELAALDFQRALELAQPQIEQNDWGIVAQAMQDRALRGLEDAEHLARRLLRG